MEPNENYPNGLSGLRIEATELDINDQQWSDATEAEQMEVTQNVLEGAFLANTLKGTHRVTVTFEGETQEAIARFDLSELPRQGPRQRFRHFPRAID